jgi:hypothetical protein
MNAVGGGGAGGAPGGGSGGTPAGEAGIGGNAGSPSVSTGGVKLRLLTQAEYRASLESLFGDVATPLELPADTSVAGFVSVGASLVTVGAPAVQAYEAASLAVVTEVFADTARWQALAGCEPQANDLSDACVETFTQTFGRRAFRRDLSDLEVEQWVRVARDTATMAGSGASGLAAMVYGLLQSPHFLYRAETNALDTASGRLKYDGRSTAIRLAFLLTGRPPSAELLAAGESGLLDSAEGVRDAASPLLSEGALLTQLTSFFTEYTQSDLVALADKDAAQFPEFNDALRGSMRESVRLFIEQVVLAPRADVRTLYDSDQFFADAALAPIYGVPLPDSGFQQLTLEPSSGRAGILSQAGILAGHSAPAFTSPTRRGLFVLQAFFCSIPDPPPPDVDQVLPIDPTLTTRERLEQYVADPACQGCHTAFDPLGLSLEHFDPIGRYRETENGLAIDTRVTLSDGSTLDGAAELGAALREDPQVIECMMRNFYRSANGRTDDEDDEAQIDDMVTSLKSRDYVFRDLVADFVSSEAFRSAPALPVAGEDQ